MFHCNSATANRLQRIIRCKFICNGNSVANSNVFLLMYCFNYKLSLPIFTSTVFKQEKYSQISCNITFVWEIFRAQMTFSFQILICKTFKVSEITLAEESEQKQNSEWKKNTETRREEERKRKHKTHKTKLGAETFSLSLPAASFSSFLLHPCCHLFFSTESFSIP